MKKIGVWNYYEVFNTNNYLLLNKDAGIGDNLLEPFNQLYIKGKHNNIDFMTLDLIDNFSDMDGFIFFDFPRMTNRYVKKVFQTDLPKYLVVLESKLIRIDNWDVNKCVFFKKIFTWSDDIANGKKYIKLNLSQKIIKDIKKDISKKKKLCTLIAGNKKINHPLELYSKRVEAIKWFEKNHPEDFDFYGVNWDRYVSGNKYIRYLFRITGLSKMFKPNYLSYKGKIDSKKDTLEKYKFSICYENARDTPGYITEKIFDCFFAGCVPIYWGANNITDHIPKECFIDKRDFEDYKSLYAYLTDLSDDKYLEYIDAIENYLKSKEAYKFSAENFANTIVQVISDDIH
jgi:hypothetical protein